MKEFITWLESQDFPSHISEAVFGIFESTIPGNQPDRQCKTLPVEYQGIIEQGFLDAIKSGNMMAHATSYKERHADMQSYTKSHDSAQKLIRMINEGKPVPLVAGPYYLYPNGSVRYTAYATSDWKSVVKFVSANLPFPPTSGQSMRILTSFTCDRMDETKRWINALATKSGRACPNVNEYKHATKARSQFIYSEMGKNINTFLREVVNPLREQMLAELNLPEDQQNVEKISDICRKLRDARAELDKMNAKRGVKPSVSEKIAEPPRSEEEWAECVNRFRILGNEIRRHKSLANHYEKEADRIKSGKNGEPDEAKISQLLQKRKEVIEDRRKIEAEYYEVKSKVLGTRIVTG